MTAHILKSILTISFNQKVDNVKAFYIKNRDRLRVIFMRQKVIIQQVLQRDDPALRDQLDHDIHMLKAVILLFKLGHPFVKKPGDRPAEPDKIMQDQVRDLMR